MAQWTVDQVGTWLKENGFKRYIRTFRDKNINGKAMMRLTDDDVQQLFIQIDEDGTMKEATIGTKSRFRTKLIEWKAMIEQENGKNKDKTPDVPSRVVSTTVSNSTDLNNDEQEESVISKKSKKKSSVNVKQEIYYLIDDNIHVQFFKNPKFLPYFIGYIKQESIPIEIEVEQVKSDNDDSSSGYTIKLTGTKQEIRAVRSFIKHLFRSITLKTFNQSKIKTWSRDQQAIDVIQNILDREIHIFTVCQLRAYNCSILEINYFNDDKFNSHQNLIEINQIIKNQILQENILLSFSQHVQTIEFMDLSTRKIVKTYQICQTGQYEEEFVNEILTKFQDLIDKYRRKKFKFNQISSTQIDCLLRLCSQELNNIQLEFQNDGIELRLWDNHFYAPQYLKNEIESRLINLLSNLKTKTSKSTQLYYDITDKLCLFIKNLAQQNHCCCEIKVKTKLKSYQIPRANENTSTASKSIIEQSNLFCSSSLVFCQAKLSNGSIEVLIGDIALQKVDVIIIPSTTYGLKESLIERAGEIVSQQPSSSMVNEENGLSSIPFITETTGGRLNCKKILFVNWSLPTIGANEDHLIESIRIFISKTIEYVIMECKQLNLKVQTIAFAVPDSCQDEQVLAEEMIEETINQIQLAKTLSLKVSFILLPDQQTLHQHFLTSIQTIQTGENIYGMFYCPTSIITTTILSADDEYLRKCEEKINNYLKRSVSNLKLDGFQYWNQHMINAFYRYCQERFVLPKIDQGQQQIVLHGSINNVYEINQKYQLTNALIQEKRNLPSRSITAKSSDGYNIMLSYSQKDSIISHRLAARLIDEGFSVWMSSNQSTELDVSLRKMTKSDCIILCLSENYFENELCEKEAKYANQIGKYIIPVKVQYYEPIEWLQKFIEKESYFQLFGSENHFNLEYDKLLLKILQHTKPGYVLSLEQTSNRENELQQNDISKSLRNNSTLYFLLTSEQRKLKYDKKVKKIMKSEKGKIDDVDKDQIEKIQDIVRKKESQCQTWISDKKWYHPLFRSLRSSNSLEYEDKDEEQRRYVWFSSGILSYRKWLEKALDLKTKLNIPPFTFSGDINDAPFPIFNEILKNPNLVSYLRNYLGRSAGSDSESEEKDVPATNHSSPPERTISQEENETPVTNRSPSPERIALQEENDASVTNRSSPSEATISPEEKHTSDILKTDEVISRRSSTLSRITVKSSTKRDTNVESSKKKTQDINKKSSGKSSFSERIKDNFQIKFAERIKQNEDELQKLCEDYEHSLHFPSKEKICSYPTAIFTPSPFSDMKVEPIKTLQIRNTIELPLKFPWNGVFDTSTPSCKWKNPSIFFFFEPTSPQKD